MPAYRDKRRPVVYYVPTQGVVRLQEVAEVPIPCPSGLTLEQIRSCESFAQKVFGDRMFDFRPVHHGQHGHNCPVCTKVLVELERRPKRAAVAPRQPWESKAA